MELKHHNTQIYFSEIDLPTQTSHVTLLRNVTWKSISNKSVVKIYKTLVSILNHKEYNNNKNLGPN